MRLFLIISMIIAICCALIIGLYTWWKINQLKNKSLARNFTNSYQNSWNNENFGTLLVDLKTQATNPLDDNELIYAINTIFRNNYQVSCILNFDSDYEKKNLTVLGKQTLNCNQFDFLLIKNSVQLINNLQNYWQKLNHKGLIFITNIDKKHATFKEIMNFCLENNLRNTYEKIGKGIILIAK